MTDRPVLFSAPMIRALLADRKTQTRRGLSRANSLVDGAASPRWLWDGLRFDEAWVDPGPSPAGNPGPYLKVPRDADGDRTVHRIYPRVQVGDHLWVKETWHPSARIGADLVEIEYKADESSRELHPPSDFMWERWDDKWIQGGWRPSLFMSRWMSRITLEVTEVRAQRVQDISEQDARAEGIHPAVPPGHFMGPNYVCSTARRAFQDLWESINGKRPGCAWKDNPFVWAISFRRVAQ